MTQTQNYKMVNCSKCCYATRFVEGAITKFYDEGGITKGGLFICQICALTTPREYWVATFFDAQGEYLEVTLAQAIEQTAIPPVVAETPVHVETLAQVLTSSDTACSDKGEVHYEIEVVDTPYNKRKYHFQVTINHKVVLKLSHTSRSRLQVLAREHAYGFPSKWTAV